MDSPGVTYRIHYLLDQSDKSQIVHYNRLRPYNAPVPDRGQQTPDCDLSLQPQLPCLTALSGALPFNSSRSAATKSYNVPCGSSPPSVAPRICKPEPQPQPQPQSQPQSHSSPSPTPWTQCLTTPPSAQVMVRQSHTVPSATPGRGSDSSLRPSRRQVKPPRYLMDYVVKSSVLSSGGYLFCFLI